MSESVDNWLSRVSETTADNYVSWWGLFMDWLREEGGEFGDYTPDMLVEYQRGADDHARYDVLDMVQRWVLGLDGKRQSTKESYYGAVKSFFMHNRAELPKDPSFNIRGDKPPVRGKLTLEDVRDVCIRSRKAYRAIFLSMFQGAMGRKEVTYWNRHGWEELRHQLDKGARIIRVALPGRKQLRYDKSYYTFIGADAVKAVRDYLPERPEDAEEIAIFYNQYGNPIKREDIWYYWHRQLKRLGLIEPKQPGYSGNRYGYNLHELRDLYRSQWEKTGVSGAVGEYFMGHKVDKNEYNKFYRDQKWTKRQYLKAMPLLNIMSSDRPYGRVDESEVQKLRREITELRSEKKKRNNQDQELWKVVKALKEEVSTLKKQLNGDQTKDMEKVSS